MLDNLQQVVAFQAGVCLWREAAGYVVLVSRGLSAAGTRLPGGPVEPGAHLIDATVEPTASLLALTGLSSGVAAPLTWQGQGVGLLVVLHAQPGYYTQPDVALTQAFVHQADMVIEMASLYADARRRALRLEAVSEVSQQLSAILEPASLLGQVLELIHAKLGYFHSHLYLVQPDTPELVLHAAHGHAADLQRRRGLRFAVGPGSRVGQAAASGQLMVSGAVTRDYPEADRELLEETVSAVAVPLRVSERVAGVLEVQSHYPDAFAAEDVTALQILADQLAIALENARLFSEARGRYQTIRDLHDIALDITARLDLDDVLSAILERAVRLLHALGSSLGLLRAETGLIHLVAFYNFPPEFKRLTLKVGEGAAGQAVATGEPQIINDYKAWADRSPAFEQSPFDAILSVPLRWEGQIIGTLNVVDRGERRPFTAEDAQSLSLFAELASIALKNAELHSAVRQAGDQLEAQVAARTVELEQARSELATKASQLQRLLKTMVHLQEEERSRIARDLHDGSNQLITGTLFELQAAQQSLRHERITTALEKLETAKELLRTIEAENRRLIAGLRPIILDTRGLAAAVKWHADAFQQHYQVPCYVTITGEPARLSAEAETAVYRIVQEALNNVAAHAQARHARVQLDFGPQALGVVVADDGVGFNPDQAFSRPAGHMGLIGMQERAQSIGGWVRVYSAPGQGARLELEVPLEPLPPPDAMEATEDSTP